MCGRKLQFPPREINRLFKKQYEQYRNAVENSELLRKEMHDMKHYLAVLKREENPARCHEVQMEERRLINLSVRQHKGFIIIECENYSENKLEIEKDRNFSGTTKGDKICHGFGLKSIQKVAEKYNGAMTITLQDGWFKVRVLLEAGKSV